MGLTTNLLTTSVLVLIGSVYIMYNCEEPSCSLDTIDLTEKIVVITGANSGIGYQIAYEAAKRNARVILGCRNPEKGRIAREKISQETGSKSVAVIGLDLSSMKRVQKFVDKLKEMYGRVDVLINNAAQGKVSAERETTREGLEEMIAINHLGPVHLSTQILPILSTHGKIITISSGSNLYSGIIDPTDLNSENKYSPGTLYAETKLLNIMMTRSFQSILKPGQSSFSVDPGFSLSLLQLPQSLSSVIRVLQPVLPSVPCSYACLTSIWLAGGKTGENEMGETKDKKQIQEYSGSGSHWYDCKLSVKVEKQAQDPELRDKVWSESKNLINSALYST